MPQPRQRPHPRSSEPSPTYRLTDLPTNEGARRHRSRTYRNNRHKYQSGTYVLRPCGSSICGYGGVKSLLFHFHGITPRRSIQTTNTSSAKGTATIRPKPTPSKT